MILGLIFGNKIIAGLLIALVTVPPIAYGGIKANEHRQVQIIVQEAKQLSSAGNYHEAINKLTEADNKWSFGEVKKEVKSLKEENKTLVQASVDYELGKELFNKDKYKDALEILKKVDSRNINYPNARSLIELAEKKVDNSSGEVEGVKTENKRATQGTPQVVPTTPTPIPVSTTTPLSTPQAQTTQRSDAYCKNEANLARMKFYDIGSKDIQNNYPELFYYDKAREKYPDRYGSDPNNSIGFNVWLQESKIQKDAYYALLNREAERLYYNAYNQCLGN